MCSLLGKEFQKCQNDASDDEEGYFGHDSSASVLLRPRRPDGGNKIDDISTLGDPFAGESFGSERIIRRKLWERGMIL
jgi:hypothetical protein